MERLMLKKVLIILFIFCELTKLYAEEIPVIVISPSNKPQSISTVGTSVTVYDEDFFENSTDYFLGDALGDSTTGYNFFQNGGAGTESAIQLRGLPKRYSTVYIDGVKMSDPSNVSNDFNFNHILTNSISRVEILKGNQSSVYGSGAIAGAINITTKKGKQGFHKDLSYNTGSYGTHNLAGALSGANEKSDYFISLERFETDGFSAMNQAATVDEKDGYRNNSIVGNFGHQYSDTIKIKGKLWAAETYLEYDAAGNAAQDYHADALQTSSNVSLVYEPNNKFTNTLTYGNSYINRNYTEANKTKDKYYGDRYTMMYVGNYNYDLDNSVVFGIEREDDSIYYNPNSSATPTIESNYVTSSYFDYQKRATEKTYLTLGSRFDNHSVIGSAQSSRLTAAHLYDGNTKFKASFGTGFRYPSLYEMYIVYANSADNLSTMQPEKSVGYDIGVEKNFPNLNLNLDLTYFDNTYRNALEGWESNIGTDTYATNNTAGTVTSRGIELMSDLKVNDILSFALNFTYTHTYDGAEADDPNTAASYYGADTRLVRVPIHAMNLATKINIPNHENLDLTIRTKYSDRVRDYGDTHNGFADVILDDWITHDLSVRYKLYDTYNLYFDINNALDERYETALRYSQAGRNFNFGLKRAY